MALYFGLMLVYFLGMVSGFNTPKGWPQIAVGVVGILVAVIWAVCAFVERQRDLRG